VWGRTRGRWELFDMEGDRSETNIWRRIIHNESIAWHRSGSTGPGRWVRFRNHEPVDIIHLTPASKDSGSNRVTDHLLDPM